ncbi:YopX family protein [Enterococcus casseliflavus]|uniref:YopX family protein n=1 Tax=Enterococcus casseliflavus TaxID=37734 RepID=UPI003D0F15CE
MVPKFRGKRKDNGEWVVGVPIPNSFCNVVHMIPILLTDKVAYPPERLHEYLIEIVPETLGQSTGLLNCETEDGKNLEGWEGDIADVGWSEQTGNFNSHRIILKSPFDYSTDEARWLIHAEYIIIRGNIYENPELLEPANEN